MISIHAPRVGRDCFLWLGRAGACISIHAPRVGRDAEKGSREAYRNISIHAPRVGRDPAEQGLKQYEVIFQSTRPVWGATRAHLRNGYNQRYFNPRAPCGARRSRQSGGGKTVLFQSTRPVWGATDQAQIRPVDAVISIHAPRVGRDIWLDDINCNDPISIHAPRVGRDLKERYPDGFDSISIHAPRVGRDARSCSTPA